MPKKKNVKFGLFPKFLISFILIAVIPMLVIEYLSYKGMGDFREDVVSQSKSIIRVVHINPAIDCIDAFNAEFI